jgi:cytochrome c
MGKGSRNAMAGGVYYSADYPKDSKVKLPNYYDGKLFAYDWSRDMIYTVSMKANGDYLGMERFLPGTTFIHPMDFAFSKDGAIYGLEYGPNWFAQNEEAVLFKLEYNAGNRSPKVAASASKKEGAAPLQVKFSSEGTLDYDKDPITYAWNFGNGQTSSAANPTHTFTKAGIYNVVLKVKDNKGNANTSSIRVKVGNDVPKVDVQIEGNKTFYWNDKPVAYQVAVDDKEDGSLAASKIAEEDVVLNINYLQGYDKTIIEQGHKSNTTFSNGKRLIDLSVEKKSIGPAYKDIAKKYRASSQNIDELSKKIISGGGGVWGEQVMAAHPQVSKADAREMVIYILGLSDAKKASQPMKGSYVTSDKGKPGTFIFSASYTDKGNGKMAPATGQKVVTLRDARVAAGSYDTNAKTMKTKVDGLGDIVVALGDQGYAAFDQIDLTGIKNIQIAAFVLPGQTAGGKMELHLGSPTGKLVGSVDIQKAGQVTMPVSVTGVNNLYFVFVNPAAGEKPLFALKDFLFEN